MPNSDSEATLGMLRRAAAGDAAGWDAVLRRYHGRLHQMVAVRLDPVLQGRFDPSDVLQETYLEASARLPEYLVEPRMPFFLWLRYLTGHHLGRLHRDNLGRRMRDARREVPIGRTIIPEASSEALARQLIGRTARPSELAQRAECKLRIQEAIERMDSIDREVLSLRHFEQLTRAETAHSLGITEAAAAKRYLRALGRLREVLATLPGGLEGLA